MARGNVANTNNKHVSGILLQSVHMHIAVLIANICQISAGSTVYLLAAGPTIFIALTGTVALKILTDKENELHSLLEDLYHYSDNYVLWGGNIALLIGIVATTLSFVRTLYEAYLILITFIYFYDTCMQITHMCYFPHKLMRRSNQPTEVNERRLLLDVSTAHS